MEPVDPSSKTNLRLNCRKSDPHPPRCHRTQLCRSYICTPCYICCVVLRKKKFFFLTRAGCEIRDLESQRAWASRLISGAKVSASVELISIATEKSSIYDPVWKCVAGNSPSSRGTVLIQSIPGVCQLPWNPQGTKLCYHIL